MAFAMLLLVVAGGQDASQAAGSREATRAALELATLALHEPMT